MNAWEKAGLIWFITGMIFLSASNNWIHGVAAIIGALVFVFAGKDNDE